MRFEAVVRVCSADGRALASPGESSSARSQVHSTESAAPLPRCLALELDRTIRALRRHTPHDQVHLVTRATVPDTADTLEPVEEKQQLLHVDLGSTGDSRGRTADCSERDPAVAEALAVSSPTRAGTGRRFIRRRSADGPPKRQVRLDQAVPEFREPPVRRTIKPTPAGLTASRADLRTQMFGQECRVAL